MSSEVTNKLVSIIILNYNAGDLLLSCVESVFRTKYDNYEVIVVDNASKDNSHKKCKQKFEKIRLIENTANLGYCEGNNVGLRQAKGNFIIILNPDTVVDPEWISHLMDAYTTYGIGLYQPKLIADSDHKKINSAGNMIQLFGFGYSRGKGNTDNGQYEKNEIVSYASGACLFSSFKVFKDLGFFDSFLFAYHDDLDLGWRAAMLGIKSYYIPKSIVYHAESFSFKWSPYKFFLLERNRHYCLLTHYSKSTIYKLLPSLILVEIAIIFFYLAKGMLKPKIMSYTDIIKNHKQIKRRYTELQRKRKIADKEIIGNFQDKIFAPKEVSDNINNELFNKLLRTLSKMARMVI